MPGDQPRNISNDQAMYEQNLLLAHRLHDRMDELENQINDGAFRAADAGLRTSVAINGGAVVALLAFSGAVLARDLPSKSIIRDMSESFLWFGGGVVAATIAMVALFAAYFGASLSYDHREKTYEHPYVNMTKKAKHRLAVAWTFLLCAMIIGVGSVGLFAIGCCVAYRALEQLPA